MDHSHRILASGPRPCRGRIPSGRAGLANRDLGHCLEYHGRWLHRERATMRARALLFNRTILSHYGGGRSLIRYRRNTAWRRRLEYTRASGSCRCACLLFHPRASLWPVSTGVAVVLVSSRRASISGQLA